MTSTSDDRALAQGAAWALGQTKRLIRASVEVSRRANAADEAAAIATAVATQDSERLLAGFLGR